MVVVEIMADAFCLLHFDVSLVSQTPVPPLCCLWGCHCDVGGKIGVQVPLMNHLEINCREHSHIRKINHSSSLLQGEE